MTAHRKLRFDPNYLTGRPTAGARGFLKEPAD